MDYDYAARAVAVRVSVLFRGPPVSGPASVAYAVGAVQRLKPYRFLKIAQLSFGAANLQMITFVHDGDARRIIAAIFELAEPVNDDRHDLLVSNITDNSTHGRARIKNE
jgi:hypothetical protein